MGEKSQDEFTKPPLLHDMKKRLRRNRNGLASKCKTPVVPGTAMRAKHLELRRQQDRKPGAMLPRKPRGIQDEFTSLPISSHQKRVLRRKRDGLCTHCQRPAAPGRKRCARHLKKAREAARRLAALRPRKSRGIQDEFTNLPVSRQRKYQLRNLKAGKCQLCGKPVVADSVMCLEHAVRRREKQRKLLGAKKRYKGTKTYRLEMLVRARESVKR